MSSAPHAWPFREGDLLALSWSGGHAIQSYHMVDNGRRCFLKSTDHSRDKDCTWSRLTPPRALRLPFTRMKDCWVTHYSHSVVRIRFHVKRPSCTSSERRSVIIDRQERSKIEKYIAQGRKKERRLYKGPKECIQRMRK